MKLSNRLQTIADMVDSASKIYDVGCDHAYLDIYLAQRGFNCLAIDVRKPVIEFASKNVLSYGLQDKIEVILNDGLNNVEIENSSIVILSGLGAKTILQILDEKTISTLIIQSNDNLYLLRKRMMERNYYIDDEKTVFEDDKYYTIIKFKFGYCRYSDYELLLGPKLLATKDSVFINYLCYLDNHFEEILKEIPLEYKSKRNEIETIINYIKMALN